jgi:zinc/manganese transport system substrate-binding protein
MALATVLLSGSIAPAHAALKVLATTPEWAALTKELGGDKVDVYAATSAFQDVHRVDAKPSLVARARSADLVVATGAELEVGWLPVLLRESGNARIQPGNPGYFEATKFLQLLEIPTAVDRSMGDIHPLGNPHAHLDPHNIALVATGLTARLMAIDVANAKLYETRGADFQARWKAATARWEQQAVPLKDMPVVVIHRDQVYLGHRA